MTCRQYSTVFDREDFGTGMNAARGTIRHGEQYGTGRTGMSYWINVYAKLFSKTWHNLTPMQYGYLLISIGVVGWLLMKSSSR